MRYFSKIVFVLVVLLVSLAFVEGVIHAQPPLPVSSSRATPRKDEQVSLCDYWPLALGNTWNFVEGSRLEITDRFVVKGYDIWEVTSGGLGIVGPGVGYWVFVDGWLYGTTDRADLELLPEIAAGMQPQFPECFALGEPFVVPSFGMTVTPVGGPLSVFLPALGLTLEDFPLGEESDTISLSLETGGSFLILGRDLGPLFVFASSILESATIVGGCDDGDEGEFEFTEIPRGSWMEEGDRLILSVGVAGTVGEVSYQWKKDGVYLHGETFDTYTTDAVTPDDEGWYGVRVSDETKGVLETDPVLVRVFAAGSLPVTETAGLCILALACITAGGFVIKHRSRGRFSAQESGAGGRG